MVRNALRAWMTVSLLALVTLSGCGWKRLLGAAPEPTKIIANASSGGDCLPWNKIYSGTEEESSVTFECYAAKEPDIWKRIHGARPDEISERELALLVHNGILTFEGSPLTPDQWSHRLIAIKNIMGFGDSITRARVRSWIDWLRSNRSSIRSAYAKMLPIGEKNTFVYTDSIRLTSTLASFLRELNWDRSSKELAPLAADLFAVTNKDSLAGLEPGVRVLRNLFGFLCPLNSPKDHIVTNEIAGCIETASQALQPGGHWVEFLIRSKDDLDEEEAARVLKSLEVTAPLVAAWFQQPKLIPLDTQLLYDWAKTLGAQPPDNFVQSLGFLRKLNGKSTEKAFDPSDVSRLFALIQNYEVMVLKGIPYYADAYRKHACLNETATSWKDCILPETTLARKEPVIDNFFRVKNPRNGFEAVPMSGYTMSVVTFFDAVGKELIDIFKQRKDDKVIRVDLLSDDDGLVNLITTSIATYQSINHYLDRLSKRIDGVTVLSEDGDVNLSKWDLRGFAKLVATTHDVLVDRTPAQRDVIMKFLDNIGNSFPQSATFLDELAITSILTTITSLPHYREYALREILGGDEAKVKDALENNTPILRTTLQASYEKMLRRNFPRLGQSCSDFRFDLSCYISFDEIMPSADDEKYVMPSDLDVLSIVGIGMEGVFDTCGAPDKDGNKRYDGRLYWDLWDGNDELDCGFVRMKDVAMRLLEAKIVHTSAKTKFLAETGLNAVNSVFVTRAIGKVALVRGTKDQIGLNLPLFWAFGRYATIGSSFGLLSDIIASDRVDAAKANPPSQK